MLQRSSLIVSSTLGVVGSGRGSGWHPGAPKAVSVPRVDANSIAEVMR